MRDNIGIQTRTLDPVRGWQLWENSRGSHVELQVSLTADSHAATSLAESCSVEEFKQIIPQNGIDEERLNIAVHILKTEKNRINLALFNSFGLANFIARTSSQAFYVGQCVEVKKKQEITSTNSNKNRNYTTRNLKNSVVGVIRDKTDDGNTFDVSIRVNGGPQFQQLEGVKAEDLTPCLNLNETKQNTQRDYLAALSEKVGGYAKASKLYAEQMHPPLSIQALTQVGQFGKTNLLLL